VLPRPLTPIHYCLGNLVPSAWPGLGPLAPPPPSATKVDSLWCFYIWRATSFFFTPPPFHWFPHLAGGWRGEVRRGFFSSNLFHVWSRAGFFSTPCLGASVFSPPSGLLLFSFHPLRKTATFLTLFLRKPLCCTVMGAPSPGTLSWAPDSSRGSPRFRDAFSFSPLSMRTQPPTVTRWGSPGSFCGIVKSDLTLPGYVQI